MGRLVSVDVETAVPYDHVVEIGLVEIIDGVRTGREFKSRFKPPVPVVWGCRKIHGLTTEMLAGEPPFASRLDEIIAFVGDAGLVAHNKSYEYNTLRKEFDRAGIPEWGTERFVCTMRMAKAAGLPGGLRELCVAMGIPTGHLGKRHDALEDARLGADVYIALDSRRIDPAATTGVAPPPIRPYKGSVALDPVQVAAMHRARVAGIRVSGSTGGGKSTLAAALAVDAARRGKRCLLLGASPRLATPPPLPGRDVRLHPTLQARFLSRPGPVPDRIAATDDHVAARAALDPEGAALALRLLARARELVELHGLTPSEVERSVLPTDMSEDTVARLTLALDDARVLADEVLGGNGRPGATLGTVANALVDPAPPEGIPAMVLADSGAALEAHLSVLAATEEAADRSRQELLRLSAALGEYLDFQGTVSQGWSQARLRARAVVEALNLLEGHATISAALSAAVPGSGEARAIARCVEKGYERKNAIGACRRLSIRDEGVVEMVEPFLPMHGGRLCADVRAVAEADKVPSAPAVDVGAVAQRLRGARHAAARLREALPLLNDALPGALMASVMAMPLNDVVVPESGVERSGKMVAADVVRALRDEFSALGYGDVLAPPDRFEERVAGARAFAGRAMPAARTVPAEILDLLLPASPLAAPDAADTLPAWDRYVTLLRPGDLTAGPGGLSEWVAAGFDVAVVDDACSLPPETLATLRLGVPVVHEVGVDPAPDVPHLDRPHRQVTTGLLALGAGGAVPRLGGPDAGGLVRRGYAGQGKFDARYAANHLADRGRKAGLDTVVVAESDGCTSLSEHDVVVVYGEHAAEACARFIPHARLAVVACAKTVTPGSGAVPSPGIETEGLAGHGWTLVASAPDGRVYGKEGKLAVLAAEPHWPDQQEEDVVSRLGRLRALGWNPVMDWSGSPRPPATLAALLEAAAVPAGFDIAGVFDVALPERPVLVPFAPDAIPFAPAGLGKQDALRWRLRYLRDEMLSKATPHVEPGRCILREEMIEAIILHGVRDKAGFQKIPEGLRGATDGIQVPLLETIGAVMDGLPSRSQVPKSSGLRVVPQPKPQLDLPDIVPPHMVPSQSPAPRAGA